MEQIAFVLQVDIFIWVRMCLTIKQNIKDWKLPFVLSTITPSLAMVFIFEGIHKS
jgi:hypothetical protein